MMPAAFWEPLRAEGIAAVVLISGPYKDGQAPTVRVVELNRRQRDPLPPSPAPEPCHLSAAVDDLRVFAGGIRLGLRATEDCASEERTARWSARHPEITRDDAAAFLAWLRDDCGGELLSEHGVNTVERWRALHTSKGDAA